MNIETSFSFPVSLFPADKRFSVRKGKEFLKGLASIEGLYGMAEEALNKIKALDLRAFDPLGMDCACHVHAFYVARIGRKIIGKSKFLGELEQSLSNLQSKRGKVHSLYESLHGLNSNEKLTKFKALVAPFGDHPRLEDVLQKLDLISELSAKVHGLIICYLLTFTKEFQQITAENKLICEHCNRHITASDGVFKEVTNNKKLVDWVSNRVKKEVNASLLDRDIFIVIRRHLIEESHRVIKKATFTAGGLRNLYFMEHSTRVVHHKPELPDYYTLTAVFRSALYKNIPVIFLFQRYAHLGHVYAEKGAKNDVGLFLLPSKYSACFEVKKLYRRSENRAVIVVHAKKNDDEPSAFLQTLRTDFDFLHLCKLDGAQHKQYTDSQRHQMPTDAIPLLQNDLFSREAKKLADLRNEALIKGLAIHSENPRFSLSHVFADTLENYRTSEYIKFFEESARCLADQSIESKTSSNLLAQFVAADERKESHRLNWRAVPGQIQTISAPNSVVRMRQMTFGQTKNELNASSSDAYNIKTHKNTSSEQDSGRTRSAEHIRFTEDPKHPSPVTVTDERRAEKQQSMPPKASELLLVEHNSKQKSTWTKATRRTKSNDHLRLKKARKHQTPSDTEPTKNIIKDQRARTHSVGHIRFKEGHHFPARDLKTVNKTQEGRRAKSTEHADIKPQFLSVKVIDMSQVNVQDKGRALPTEQVLIKRERRRRYTAVIRTEIGPSLDTQPLVAIPQKIDHLQETSRTHSTRGLLIKKVRVHQFPPHHEIVGVDKAQENT